MIGDLYVSEDTKFYKNYIKDKYSMELRDVNWNGENGPWNVVVDEEKRIEIINYIVSRGGRVFESDETVMEYLISLYERKEA